MNLLETAGVAGLFAFAGAVSGWICFHLHKFSLRFLEPGRRSMGWFFVFAAGRLGLFAAGGAAAVFFSIYALVAYTVVFLVVRTLLAALVRVEGEDEPD